MVRILHHYLPRSLVLLALAEIFILVLAVYAGMQIYANTLAHEATGLRGPLLPKAMLFAAVMFASLLATGLYWQHSERELFRTVARIIISFFLGGVVLAGLFYAFPSLVLPQDGFGVTVQIGLIGVLFAHIIHRQLSNLDSLKRRVLVVGAGKMASQLVVLEGTDVEIVGYVPVPGQEECANPRKLLDADRSLLDLVREHEVHEIVVALDDRRKRMPVDDLLECKLDGVEITDVTRFVEQRLQKIDLGTLSPSKIFFSGGFRKTPFITLGKRLFDISASLLLLIVIWPVMILVALAIFIEAHGRGPLLYTQVRVGQGGSLFKVFKFRSMRVDAEKGGQPQYAEEEDPRVTRVGRILRKLRIDELPQLFNVLRGEMSFVGPRPERPEFVQEYLGKIPYYGLRHEIKPGITGWAQISYPYGSGEKDTVEKLQYDLYYMKHFDLLFDLNILFQTAHTVILGSGAR